jgi:hypothetical protein
VKNKSLSVVALSLASVVLVIMPSEAHKTSDPRRISMQSVQTKPVITEQEAYSIAREAYCFFIPPPIKLDTL